ncbi:MAG TPA: type II secretion system protein [Candidatus Paceibacterota bacterium]
MIIPNFKLSNNDQNGFTVAEFVTVLGIVSILMAISLYNYSGFNDRAALSSATQEISLAIRQAQSYGLNVRETTVGSGNFSSAFGVYFHPNNDPTNYYIFVDNNPANGKYDAGAGCGTVGTECIQSISIRNGVRVIDIDSTDGCGSANSARSLNIMFRRPNLDASLNFVNNGGNFVCNSPPRSGAKIVVRSKNGVQTEVTVQSTGQVYVVE